MDYRKICLNILYYIAEFIQLQCYMKEIRVWNIIRIIVRGKTEVTEWRHIPVSLFFYHRFLLDRSVRFLAGKGVLSYLGFQMYYTT